MADSTPSPSTNGERLILGERTHHYNNALDEVYYALTRDRSWMQLAPGEVMPRILETRPLHWIVWSSFWPVSPDDTIEIELRRVGEIELRFRWLSSSPPDARGIGITRQRLNRKFGGDIRGVLGGW